MHLEEARAALILPNDPRLTQDVLFEAISAAHFKVRIAGMRPNADFETRAARVGLETLTQGIWRSGDPILFPSLKAATHIRDGYDAANKICTLVGPDSMQGIPTDILEAAYLKDVKILKSQPATPAHERKIREALWMVDIINHHSRDTLLTPDDPEWKELQPLLAYRIYQERADKEKGTTYHADEALSIKMMQSRVFAHVDDFVAKAAEAHVNS